MTTEFGSNQTESLLWDKMVLPNEVKNQLQETSRLIQLAASQKPASGNGPHLLISGPPGTGKTMIARTFSRSQGMPFMSVAGPEFRMGYCGQSSLKVKEIFSKARSSAPCILNIDFEQGPYSDFCIFPRRDSPGYDLVCEEVILETSAQIERLRKDRCPLFIIGETFSTKEVNPWILREFEIKIEIPLPDEDGRRDIILSILRKYPMDPTLNIDEVSSSLAKRLEDRSGRDFEYIGRQALERATRRILETGGSPEEIWLTYGDLLAIVEESESRRHGA